ncbi:MAG TPA: hypothetical protein VN929_04495 [Burkholderiales bacterium]|nr:hypothetical protein [Burkholderiales bacterium]
MKHIRESFARQKAMDLIGASLTLVERGRVEVRLPYRDARAEVYAEDGTHVASMQQTLMMLANTPDTP